MACLVIAVVAMVAVFLVAIAERERIRIERTEDDVWLGSVGGEVRKVHIVEETRLDRASEQKAAADLITAARRKVDAQRNILDQIQARM